MEALQVGTLAPRSPTQKGGYPQRLTLRKHTIEAAWRTLPSLTYTAPTQMQDASSSSVIEHAS